MSKKQTVELSPRELGTFIEHIIENNRLLQEKGKPSVSINVEGHAGIGKTSKILQVAKEMNMDCVKLNLAQIEELGDLVGFPVKEFKVESETESIWISESTLDYHLKNGYKYNGEKRLSYAPPEWIQGKGESGILLLDDWTRADSRFTQACMELIDRQEYISWKLPKDWHIILSSNPDDGKYLVNSIDDAQRTRFITVNMRFDIDSWSMWAEENEVDSRCINFLRLNREIISSESGINPRSISTFFNAISSIKNFSSNLGLIEMIGAGSVGFEVAAQFVLFVNNNLDKIINPYDIFKEGTSWETVEQQIKDSINVNGSFRADIASLICSRISTYCLVQASNKDRGVTKFMLDRLKNILKSTDLFTPDLVYVMNKTIIDGDRVKFQTLLQDPQIVKNLTK